MPYQVKMLFHAHCLYLFLKKRTKKEMVMQIKTWLVALVAMCVSSMALADDYYVDITNNTGYTIVYMHVSPGNSKSWEEDVLGNDVLMDGDTQRVTLTGYNSPYFDVRLIDEDEDSYTFWNVDVSTQDLVVTLDNLD